MAEKRTPSYQDYEEAQWGIDTARNKFAPWLIVHCRRTETYYDSSDEGIGSLTGTTTVSTSSSFTLTLVPTQFTAHIGYHNNYYIEDINWGFNNGYYPIGPQRITKAARYKAEFTPATTIFGESTTSDSLYNYVIMLMNMQETTITASYTNQWSQTTHFHDTSRFNLPITTHFNVTHTYSISGSGMTDPIAAMHVYYWNGLLSMLKGGLEVDIQTVGSLKTGDWCIEGYTKNWNLVNGTNDGMGYFTQYFNIMNNGGSLSSSDIFMELSSWNLPNGNVRRFTLFYDETSTVVASVSSLSFAGAWGISSPWRHWVMERYGDIITVYVNGRVKGTVDVSTKTLHD